MDNVEKTIPWDKCTILFQSLSLDDKWFLDSAAVAQCIVRIFRNEIASEGNKLMNFRWKSL